MWSEIPELAKLLRDGTTRWEDLSLDDVDIRMKFAGMFHRGKRTPQRFMMRLKVRTAAGQAVQCCRNGRLIQLVSCTCCSSSHTSYYYTYVHHTTHAHTQQTAALPYKYACTGICKWPSLSVLCSCSLFMSSCSYWCELSSVAQIATVVDATL